MPGARADAELAPARAPAAGRLARSRARCCSPSCPRSRRAPGSGSSSSRGAAVVAIAVAIARPRRTIPGARRRGSGTASSTPTTSGSRSTRRSTSTSTRSAPRGLRASRPASRSPRRSGGRSSRWRVFIVGATWPATLLTNDRDLLRGAVDPRRRAVPAGRASRAPAAVDRARRAARRRARRRRARGRDPAGGGQERVPALADVEADHPPAGPGRRPLRLGLELRRLHAGRARRRPSSRCRRRRGRCTGARRRSTSSPARAGSSTGSRNAPELFDGRLDLTQNDPLAPPAARDPATWKKAQFEIASLADDHIVAPSVPVGYEPAFSGADFFQGGSGRGRGRARARPALRRLELLAASDVRAARGRPATTTARLRCRTSRSIPGLAAPRFGTPEREAVMRALLRRLSGLQAALLAGAARRRERAEPVRRGARARVVAPRHRRLRLHAASAARPRRAAPRLRHRARSAATASTSPARWR